MKEIQIKDENWIVGKAYKKQILADDTDFQSTGNLAQVVVIEPGSTVKPHYHKHTFEFYYVMEGRCKITIGNSVSELGWGDMMLTEPGDVHSVFNCTDSDFVVLVFKSNAKKDDTYWLEDDN